MRQTFSKSQRLKGKKNIEQVLGSGKNIFVYPLLWFWVEKKEVGSGQWAVANCKLQTANCKIAISVPKKRIRRAVDRNKIKRRIREAYRKNIRLLTNYEILQNNHLHLALMIIYTANEILPYREIEKKMIVSLQKIAKQITSGSSRI